LSAIHLHRPRRLPWLLLATLLSTTAHAACLAPAQGELKALDALAFKAPAEALVKLNQLVDLPAMQPPVQRAVWSVLASDATRQLGQGNVSLAHAEAGLVALAPDTSSPLALRLRVARAVQIDDNAQAISELNAVLIALGNNPLGRGCVLRDRGWLRMDTGQLDGALGDLIESYNLLLQHADRDEQMVAMGRLSVAYVRGGDHSAALRLVDESVAHFRSTNALVRLTTALSRRSDSLVALKRLPEAEDALREALLVSRSINDKSSVGEVLLRLCGVVGKQEGIKREQEALGLCNEAERVLRDSRLYDEDTRITLALLRAETLRSRPPSASELAALNDVVNAASTGGGPDFQARAYRTRSQALAARGDHRAALADLLKYVDLLRTATATERVNAQAAMRVGFETDRALARSAVLDQQNQLSKERLWWVVLAAIALMVAAGGLGYALVLNRRHQLRLTLVAERDDLTGLPNRRKIMEDAEQQFALARRRGSELVLGMVDLDHFKRINDQHGHAGGDLVLSGLGKTARTALRTTDAIGRWGGEEFLLVLPDCNLTGGLDVAQRVRGCLAGHAIQTAGGVPVNFTVSIGLAAVMPTDINLQALLQRADRALYAAKAQGRDRVVLDGIEASDSATVPHAAAGSEPVVSEPRQQRRRAERRQRSVT
jgi:diguanylate cyclase (GGDEF)-like protein